MKRGFWVCGLLALPLGCGAHADDQIPSDLLDAIGSQSSDGAYPSGPKGSAVGDVAANVCVTGWSDPSAASFDVARMKTLCFADFYEPDADGPRLLLVNTAALWCSACQVEYGGSGARASLDEEVATRQDRGLSVLGTLFQDAAQRPAEPSHGADWARAFDVGFPFGIDPDFAMGAFADADVQPFNMVIDAHTMRIVLRVDGDNPDQLWPAIDERLGAE
jgi:hypothetical protein